MKWIHQRRRAGAACFFGMFALPVAVAACSPSAPGYGDPAEMDHSALSPVAVVGEVVAEPSDLGLPFELEVLGEHLVILDAASDSAVLVMRKDDGELIRSFGRRGHGPGEYEGAWSVDPVAGSDQQFWIYDASLHRLTHVDLSRDFEGGARHGERIINLVAEATVLDPTRLDSIFVSLGFFQSGRLGQFDEEGRFLRTVGSLPQDAHEVPPQILQHAFQSTLEPNPSRTLLAVATRHADRLEIYRPDGTLVASARPPFGFLPKFEVRVRRGEPSMATGDDLRFGYVDLATTEDHIYALFSGRTRYGFPGTANYGEYVHVYDWEGRLQTVVKLDSEALAIAVDTADRSLYALRHDPRPAVVRYGLPIDQGPTRVGKR